MSNPLPRNGPEFKGGLKNKQYVSPTYASSFGNTIHASSPQNPQKSPQIISSGEKFVSGRSPRKNSGTRHINADEARSHCSDDARSGSYGSRGSPGSRNGARIIPALQQSPRAGSNGSKSRGTFQTKTKVNGYQGGMYIADIEDEEVQRNLENRTRMDAENQAMVEAKRKLKVIEKQANLDSDQHHLQNISDFNRQRSQDRDQAREHHKKLREFDHKIGQTKKRMADLERKGQVDYDAKVLEADQDHFQGVDMRKLQEKLESLEQHQNYLDHQVAQKLQNENQLAANDKKHSSPQQNS